VAELGAMVGPVGAAIIGGQRGCVQQLRIERGEPSKASTAIGSLKIFARPFPRGLAAAISDRDRRATMTPPLPPNCAAQLRSAATTCSPLNNGYFPSLPSLAAVASAGYGATFA
jgi:hypothetical protein